MVIESYSFGNIVIDGSRYSSDLIIYPDGKIVAGWWRQNGHLMTEADIAGLIAASPEVIVVGTGASGMLKPERGIEKVLGKKGIRMLAAPCRQALNHFNALNRSKKVGACFHLTC
jgi:hypothetical protein